MRKYYGVLMLLLAVGLTACGSAAPDAGEEAVLIRQPRFFGHGGVDDTPVRTGLKYVAPSTRVVMVNMQPRQQEITFDDLFTADGVPLDFHSAVQYRITDSVKLVRDFGADDGPKGMGFFVRNLEQQYRMIVRDAVKKHGLNEMAINVSAADAVDREVTDRFKEVIANVGVPITLLGVTLGRASPPDAIKHQRIATAEQEQRQKTEQQAKLAEDQRRAHEESRALADNAYRESMKLSVEQYIALMQINMLRETCAGGKCTFINGAVSPVFPVK
jgi:regulator of protease activity HflC (stomatin/prohibitin superfamily)